jgi:hypothetical protein
MVLEPHVKSLPILMPSMFLNQVILILVNLLKVETR